MLSSGSGADSAEWAAVPLGPAAGLRPVPRGPTVTSIRSTCRRWIGDVDSGQAADMETCEVGSLRRHRPDQVVEVAFGLSGLSALKPSGLSADRFACPDTWS